MSDKIISYAVVFIVALALGAMLMNQCSTPEVTNTVTIDTLRITQWLVKDNWKTKVVTKRDTLRVPFAVTDSVLCCEQLTDCMDERWMLANLEAEAEQTLPNGATARVSFSMPLYREKPENAFTLLVTIPDTSKTNTVTVYAERKWYHRIGASVGIGYGIGPLGMGPSVNIQAGYTLFELSDIWR